MLGPMRLWVTRTAPANLVTASRLRAMGHKVVALPVLEVHAVADAPPPAKPDAIVFTSMHGVRHHRADAAWRDVPVYAVGDSTGGAARQAGYRRVSSAGGDVRDLEALILREMVEPARILHFSPSEPAGALCERLRSHGHAAERHVVYETHAAGDGLLAAAMASLGRLDAILVHSPKGARRVAELISGSGWAGTIFCISAACAFELRALPGIRVRIAGRPTEQSLLALVRPRAPAPAAVEGRPRRSYGWPIRGGALAWSAVANDNWSGPHAAPPSFGPEDPEDPPPSAA